MKEMWRKTPLTHLILYELRRSKGSMTDQDLYREVQKRTDEQIPFSDFLKALMSLEMRGFISVSLIREDTRMITVLGDRESE